MLDVDVESVFEKTRRRDKHERAGLGTRARSLVRRRQGKYSRHGLARQTEFDVAVDATIRAAAVRSSSLPVRVDAQDLRRKVREHRSPFAVCFVLDNSWSVHADQMIEKVKGVTLALLHDAAHRGDKVALVAFRGGMPEATVALPLTKSAHRAAKRLQHVPVSGRTPLPHALRLARRLLRQERIRRPNAIPVLVVVTDGLPTVPLRPSGDARRDIRIEARALRRAGVTCVVADSALTEKAKRLSCGPELARLSGGACLPLAELAPDVLLDEIERIV